MLRVLDRLGPRFAWRASGGASDFAHCSESRQSHKAVSSSCRGRFHARSSTDYPFTSSCSPRPDRQDAVSFRCLAGSTARKGLAPFGVCAFPSARARVSSPAACKTTPGASAFHRPSPSRSAAGEETRAPAFGRGSASGLVKPPWGAAHFWGLGFWTSTRALAAGRSRPWEGLLTTLPTSHMVTEPPPSRLRASVQPSLSM